MSYYSRIDVSEGIDVNKTNESRKCFIYNHYHFPYSTKKAIFYRKKKQV